MYQITFTTVNKLFGSAPAIYIEFPKDGASQRKWQSIDTTCYEVIAPSLAGLTCAGVLDTNGYHIIKLTGFSEVPANTAFNLKLFAQPGSQASTVQKIRVSTMDTAEDLANMLTDQEEATTSQALHASYVAPAKYELLRLKQPKVELRAGEYSALTFDIKPKNEYLASSSVV
jgi:hypothetical protein